MNDDGFLNEKSKNWLSIGDFAMQYSQADALSSLRGRGPECPYCGANIAKHGARVCMHCTREIAYIQGKCVTPAEFHAYAVERDRICNELQTQMENIVRLNDSSLVQIRKVLDVYKNDSAWRGKIAKWIEVIDREPRRRKEEARRSKEEANEQRRKDAFIAEHGKKAWVNEKEKETISSIALRFWVYGYALYSFSCLSLDWLGYEPWFWNSMPTWLYWSLWIAPILLIIFFFEFVYFILKRFESDQGEEKAFVQSSRMSPQSSSRTKASRSSSKKLSKNGSENAENMRSNFSETYSGSVQSEPDAGYVCYFIRRGEMVVLGPAFPEDIINFANAKNLRQGDEISTSISGPWRKVDKEDLVKMKKNQPIDPNF